MNCLRRLLALIFQADMIGVFIPWSRVSAARLAGAAQSGLFGGDGRRW
jgi:hypothetical protein